MANVLYDEPRLQHLDARTVFAVDDAVDADLVVAARTGDLHAFASLYDRHQDRLLRFCRSRLGDADDAADAAQETFLRAWRALHTFGNRSSFYPWLHAIARNVCTDTLRKRSRVETSDDTELSSLQDQSASVVDLLDAEADTEVLRAALGRLSERHREILAMREYDGWTYERIADEEQLELNAVKSLVWRARQALRREFLLLTSDGRFGGVVGVGALLRRIGPSFRRSVDRLAFTASQVTSASGSAVGNASAAAAGAVSVAVVAIGVVGPTPPAPPPAVPVPVASVVAAAPRTTSPTTAAPQSHLASVAAGLSAADAPATVADTSTSGSATPAGTTTSTIPAGTTGTGSTGVVAPVTPTFIVVPPAPTIAIPTIGDRSGSSSPSVPPAKATATSGDSTPKPTHADTPVAESTIDAKPLATTPKSDPKPDPKPDNGHKSEPTTVPAPPVTGTVDPTPSSGKSSDKSGDKSNGAAADKGSDKGDTGSNAKAGGSTEPHGKKK